MSRYPESVAKLAVWWISGGNIGLMSLGLFYCAESANAANRGGMEAVAAAPAWADPIARNPGARDALLAQDRDTFVETMQKWAFFFAPSPDSPVPGMSPADFARLTMPVLLFRNGVSDLAHTRRTSEWVHALTPTSRLIEAPWPDEEWNRRTDAAMAERRGLFEGWPALAPDLLAFIAD